MDHRRYSFLDGIRGVAAILVLTRHTQQYWRHDFFRSYLAVDLFFILSGFVIGSAYDKKLSTGFIGPWDFLKIRIIRLYPVFLFSVALLFLANYYQNTAFGDGGQYTFYNLGIVAIATCLFIPWGLANNAALFPLNGPYWSLLYELLTNAIYALIRPILTTPTLVAIVCVSFSLLVPIALKHGSLDIGFNRDAVSIYAGLLRSIFGIFLGLLIQRWQTSFCSKFGHLASPWYAFSALVAVLISPSVNHLNVAIDMAAIGALFPLLVLMASQPTSTRYQTFLLLLGSASYPIYVLQVPVAMILTSILPVDPRRFAPISGLLLTAFLIFFSVLLEKAYDIPVRRGLSSYFLRKR